MFVCLLTHPPFLSCWTPAKVLNSVLGGKENKAMRYWHVGEGGLQEGRVIQIPDFPFIPQLLLPGAAFLWTTKM